MWRPEMIGNLPVVFGCATTSLSAEEKDFFEACRPAGFILFARNIENADQVRRLVGELKATRESGRTAILIDQEGGRVQRLGPPRWPAYPAMDSFGQMFEQSPAVARAALRLNLAHMTVDLNELGINVNCLPVLDLPAAGADPIIGDRAFSEDPQVVAELGATAVEALLEFGCLPVIKHIPGHGRATADSHKSLPIVEATLEELERTDFLPFKACRDAPLAMTAHVTYAAIDPDNPASTSEVIISEIIRGALGFRGLLISDDISMGALEGDFAERANRVLGAGVDLVLHCNGEMAEMEEVARSVEPLAPAVAADLDLLLGEAETRRRQMPLNLAQLEDEAWDGKA